jgi:hypothetical protein
VAQLAVAANPGQHGVYGHMSTDTALKTIDTIGRGSHNIFSAYKS